MKTPTLRPRKDAVRPGTNQEKVLNYLKTGHSLDNAKALSLYGYFRFSDVIHDLREKGYDIRTESSEPVEGKTFTVYRYYPPMRHGKKVKVLRPGPYYGHIGRVVEDWGKYGGYCQVRFDYATNGIVNVPRNLVEAVK